MTESMAKPRAKGTSRASKPAPRLVPRSTTPKPLPRSVSARRSSGQRRPEGRRLDLSDTAQGSQCEAPLARHDVGRRHLQWLGLSSHARARRPRRPLAQSGPQVARSGGRRGGRRCLAGNRASGRGTGTQGAGRSAEGSRGRPPEGAGGMVGHHARRAQRLDPVDRLRQAGRDALEADRQCLRYARQRQARPCCFDRSGMYAKSLSCPVADDTSSDTRR